MTDGAPAPKVIANPEPLESGLAAAVPNLGAAELKLPPKENVGWEVDAAAGVEIFAFGTVPKVGLV